MTTRVEVGFLSEKKCGEREKIKAKTRRECDSQETIMLHPLITTRTKNMPHDLVEDIVFPENSAITNTISRTVVAAKGVSRVESSVSVPLEHSN
jgi:hypothetical protein